MCGVSPGIVHTGNSHYKHTLREVSPGLESGPSSYQVSLGVTLWGWAQDMLISLLPGEGSRHAGGPGMEGLPLTFSLEVVLSPVRVLQAPFSPSLTRYLT